MRKAECPRAKRPAGEASSIPAFIDRLVTRRKHDLDASCTEYELQTTRSLYVELGRASYTFAMTNPSGLRTESILCPHHHGQPKEYWKASGCSMRSVPGEKDKSRCLKP